MNLGHVVTVGDVLDAIEIGGFTVSGVCACLWAYLHLTERWRP